MPCGVYPTVKRHNAHINKQRYMQMLYLFKDGIEQEQTERLKEMLDLAEESSAERGSNIIFLYNRALDITTYDIEDGEQIINICEYSFESDYMSMDDFDSNKLENLDLVNSMYFDTNEIEDAKKFIANAVFNNMEI
ncbi:hypothetical protein ACEPOF_000381 [Acinetobacter baumannii]